MAGVGPGDLYELADELLEVCVAALDSVDDSGWNPPAGYESGAPDRQFVSPHAPIPDCCEFLAVHVNGIGDQYVRANDAGSPKVNLPQLIMTLLRCVPQGTGDGANYTPPPVAELQAASRLLYADAWAIWNRIYNLIRAEQFLTRCARVTVGPMQSIAPEGGCGGWQLAVTPNLDGYNEELGT